MIQLIIWLILLLIVLYVVNLIVDQLALPGNVKPIVMILISVIFLLVLLQRLGIVGLGI